MNLTDAQIERYSRHIILPEVGGKGQARLLAGRVLIVGAGPAGCVAAWEARLHGKELDILLEELSWHVEQLESVKDGFQSCPGPACTECEFKDRCDFYQPLLAESNSSTR